MNPIWLLMLAVGLVGSNSLVLSPLAAEVAGSFAPRSPEEVMIASAIYGGAVAVSALIVAPHGDRVGLRNALIWALWALTAALGLSAVAPNLWMLAGAQALAGVAAGVVLPACYGLAAELAPKGREAATLGRVILGWTISMVAGVTLSAILADATHWRVVFAVLGGFGVAISLALTILTTETRPRAVGRPPAPWTVLRIPGVTSGLTSVALFMIAFYGVYAYLGTHMTQVLGVSTALTGLVTLSYGIGFGLAAPLDALADRYGPARATPTVLAVLVGLYLLLGGVHASALGILAVAAIWGVFQHLGLNLLVGRLAAIDPTRRAAIMGLNSSVTYVAMFAGTAGFKPIFLTWGHAGSAVAAALCLLPALALALAARRGLQVPAE